MHKANDEFPLEPRQTSHHHIITSSRIHHLRIHTKQIHQHALVSPLCHSRGNVSQFLLRNIGILIFVFICLLFISLYNLFKAIFIYQFMRVFFRIK